VAFPLPLDPLFRKEIVNIWILDIGDRLKIGDGEGANQSWKIAQEIYLSLPPGNGDDKIESALFQARVKLDNTTLTTNENNF
jgi:hypothetical protein